MLNDLRKISFFPMRDSNLTSKVLVKANITWDKRESWVLMEINARKLHWKKITSWCESRKVEEKKY